MGQRANNERERNKLIELEGLRGIAAAAVVFHHFQLNFGFDLRGAYAALPFPLDGLAYELTNAFANGKFAVYLFWTLSAFVLSLKFFAYRRKGAPSSANRYVYQASIRRYFRLAPPVAVSVLGAYLLYASGLMFHNEARAILGHDSIWFSFYQFPSPTLLEAIQFALWNSLFDYQHHRSYNPVLWSIELEFYGSLCLFASLTVGCRTNGRFLAYPIAVVILYSLKLYWLNAFLIGVLLCDLYVLREQISERLQDHSPKIERAIRQLQKSPGLFITGTVALLLCISLFDYNVALYPVLSVASILLVLFSKPAKALLSLKAASILGRLSFGLYLIHAPVIFSLSNYLFIQLVPQFGVTTASYLACLFSLPAILLLSWLLYALVDSRSISLSYRAMAVLSALAPKR